MSKYDIGPIDFSRLHTVPQVRAADFASLYREVAGSGLGTLKYNNPQPLTINPFFRNPS